MPALKSVFYHWTNEIDSLCFPEADYGGKIVVVGKFPEIVFGDMATRRRTLMCRVTTWWGRLKWSAGTGPGTAMRQLTAQPASRSSAVIPSKHIVHYCLSSLPLHTFLEFLLFPLIQLIIVILIWTHYFHSPFFYIFYLATAYVGIDRYSPNQLGPDISVTV